MTGIRTKPRLLAIGALICSANSPRARIACARFLNGCHLLHNKSPCGYTGFCYGAGDGNRTRVFGLGSGHSAIELHLLGCLTIIIQNALGVKCPSAFYQKSFRHYYMSALVFCSFTKNCGSCAKTIAANTSAHPPNSRGVSVFLDINQPPSAAKTLSKLMVRDAMAGSA